MLGAKIPISLILNLSICQVKQTESLLWRVPFCYSLTKLYLKKSNNVVSKYKETCVVHFKIYKMLGAKIPISLNLNLSICQEKPTE